MTIEEQLREQLVVGIKTENEYRLQYELLEAIPRFKFDIGDRVLYERCEFRIFKREYCEESLSMGKFDRRKKEIWYTLASCDGSALCSSVKERDIKKVEG